jgi:hypothetical protein
VGKETRYVTKLLKNYNVDIAWRTNNSLEHHLSIKRHNKDIHTTVEAYIN